MLVIILALVFAGVFLILTGFGGNSIHSEIKSVFNG
jgi:hypothetical protein